MEGGKMNNKDLTEDFSASNVYETLTGLLSGDIGAGVKLMEIGINSIKSIPDYLFYRNLTAVLSELKSKGTANRKVGKKLAESAYGEKYGYTLLHYIHEYEHEQKGGFMAHLLDAVSHNFISPDDCFRYCKMLNDISLASLCFLKENVHKRALQNSVQSNRNYIDELKRNGLMYDSDKEGAAFELEAYLLDKFALSYETEKYNYSDLYGGIPHMESFPKRPQFLTT